MHKVGIWGGSFDPIHVGHLILAQEAISVCSLDELVWIPSGSPPHKAGPIASGSDRLRMIELAIEGLSVFSASRIEVDREGKSYTVQTLEDLGQQFGQSTRLCLLIGADNAVDFGSWYKPERVFELADVAVFGRLGSDTGVVQADLAAQMSFLETPLVDMSSTGVRDRVKQGLSIRFWVPEAVRSYIEGKGLYR